MNKADLRARDSMILRENALQSDYKAKLQRVVDEYELKMVEHEFSIQTLSNELNRVSNSKEELNERVCAAEIACVQKEFEVERLHREIVAYAAAFNQKVSVEVLAAKVAFNEELAVQALELHAHFDRKLDLELAAAKAFAIEQHSAELEVLNYEHELELCAERDKYQKLLTSEMNKYNMLRDDYANKLKTRHQQIGIRVAPSQPCTVDEEAYVEGHVAPRHTFGVDIVVDESVPGIEGRCDGILSSSSTHCNEKYTLVTCGTTKTPI